MRTCGPSSPSAGSGSSSSSCRCSVARFFRRNGRVLSPSKLRFPVILCLSDRGGCVHRPCNNHLSAINCTIWAPRGAPILQPRGEVEFGILGMLAAFSQRCLSKVTFVRKASSKLRRQLLVYDRSHWTSWLSRYNSSMADKGTGNEAAGVDPPPEQKSEKKLKKEAKKEAKLAKYKDKVKQQQQAQPTAQSEVIVPPSPTFFPSLLP